MFITTMKIGRTHAMLLSVISLRCAAIGAFPFTTTGGSFKWLTMPTNKFYAVAIGRTIGVFNTWNECQKEVRLRHDVSA